MIPIPGASPDNPPGWIGLKAPKTLAELVDYLSTRLEWFRDFPRKTPGYMRVVQSGGSGGVTYESLRPDPRNVACHLHLAQEPSDNAIRWLDHHGIVAGRPEGVSKSDDVPTAERKLSDLLKFVSELAQSATPDESPTHSPDFRSVNWFGTPHEFTAQQAACVKVLWEAWENRTPTVGDSTILEAADSDAERLGLVFRDHPAWETMIVAGSTKGTHRLAAEPPKG